MPAHEMPNNLRVIGKNWRKVDARAKCTGLTKYADDLVFPRMLHCKMLRSSEQHARIVKVDTTKAERLPGVEAVLVGTEMPIPFGILPISQDEHPLCIDKVRFVGDPVAAVAAVDEETADEATRLIEVAYEPLKEIMSIQEALKTPEPRIHDYGDEGNIHKRVSLEFGDITKGLGEADEVVEDFYYYEGNTHLAMEQHAAVGVWDPDGKVTIYSSTQTPHYLHRAASKVLGLAPSHIRIIATTNGGGFGGKSDPFNHEIVVAKLAMKTGRPVKICLTREEVFYCHRGRHPVLMWVRMGVKKDGTITGLHFRSMLDGGAYGSYGVASTYYTGALQTVTYKVPHYKFEGLRTFTNKPPCGPKRGHGTVQPRHALEIHIDKVAERLSIDPAELRKKICVDNDSLTANYLTVGSCMLRECLDKVVEGSGWKSKFRKLPYGKGVGLACASYLSGAGLPIYWNNMPHSGVQIKCDRGGGVTVFCGSTEIGQGSDSVLAYVVAEVLGLDPFDLRIVTADTDLTPVDLGSYSSRVTLMTGNAAIQAAERIKEPIARAVGEKLGVPSARLAFADRRVFDVEDPSKGMTWAEAVQFAEARFGTIGAVGSYTPPVTHGKFKGAGVGPSPAYSYMAAVAEVDVDVDTGIVRCPKFWIAYDCGKALNPLLVIGQVEGSIYMGLGEALMEEQIFRLGVHKFPSLLEYKSPTTMEMPDVVTWLVEGPDKNGPFGAKEAGQGPLLPVAPAIANAVYDAVRVRVDEVPIQPEKVLAAMRSASKRFGPKSMPTVNWGEPIKVPTPWEGGTGRAAETGEKPVAKR